MNTEILLSALLIQVILTLFIFIVLAQRKAKAIRRGEVNLKSSALHYDAWPDYVLQVTNNIQNQFQTPILFYVLSFAFILIDKVDGLVLIGAWIYVLSRYVHAYIHINSNYVPSRLKAFFVGLLAIFYMAILLLIKLMF